MTACIVTIYRCQKKPGAYLYVPKDRALTQLPESLVQALGTLEQRFSFLLTADKPLARAAASDVLQQLAGQGFYLQMPPGDDPDKLDPRQGAADAP